jgi:Family of unknown function (DUF6399)
VPDPDSTAADRPPATPRRSRAQAAALLDAFRHGPDRPSQRRFARQQAVPRSTLRHWLRRQQRLDLDPLAARFFESPQGLALLHRLILALHLVFALQGTAGLRLLTQFLRLTGLDRLVAASHGARHRFAALVEQAVGDFADAQRARLAAAMAARAIAVAEDETFHPATCLVAVEPVSGFLLLEQYAERRDAATWDAALGQALAGLPVTVACAVGDEAKGLLAHARHGLGVPHSPDVFHVQQELSRAAGPALAAQARRAARDQEAARQQAEAARAAAEQAAAPPRRPGRPPDHAARVRRAGATAAEASHRAEACQGRQERARAAVRGFGDDDHPFDLSTGAPQGAPAVQRRLDGRLAALAGVAREAGLAGGWRERLAKARRVVPGLVAAVAYFWGRVRAAVAAAYGARAWPWAERLLAGMYLRQAAAKAKGAERRRQLRALAEACLAEARAQGAEPPGGWPAAEALAAEWAGWFQRSSSCVEGRNGQLALRHHSLHRLSRRKLRALTALHNYWLKRPDGTTAAERFFGGKPADLFGWLLERLPLPARPARRRPRGA